MILGILPVIILKIVVRNPSLLSSDACIDPMIFF